MALEPASLRLDPWEGEWGASLNADDAAREDECTVDLEAEVSGKWEPIRPVASNQPVVFIDGVRRVDARVVAVTEHGIVHGAFGSYGVGAVESNGGHATFADVRVERLLVLGNGESVPAPLQAGAGLTFRPHSTSREEQPAPGRAVHDEMRSAEAQLAIELAARHTDALLITDGPIHELVMPGRAVGYIKRLFKLYVPGTHLPVLESLRAGTRTPIFGLRQERFRRYAWFARLVEPRPTDSPLAGLVRMEVPDSVGIDEARRLADLSTARVPEFVAHRGRDPRAPQNLMPISGLEAHLRHLLGDPRVVRRQIEDVLAAAATAHTENR